MSNIQNGKPCCYFTQELAAQMAIATHVPRSNKRASARIAIMNVIRSYDVKPGDLLPPEIELTKILGVSLGTVQAALRGLQDTGVIVRKRGDGTRVASVEPFGESLWHFRFVSRDDNRPLQFVDEKTWVDILSSHGIWSNYLGRCERYVRIRRILTSKNGVRAGAEMFLDASSAEGLENIDASELTHTNIRPYLEKEYGLSTKGSFHSVQTRKLDEEIATDFGLTTKGDYFEIHAKAFSHNRNPTYFQSIYAATSDCALVF